MPNRFTDAIKFLVSPQHRALYDAAAQAEGVSLSFLLRRALHQHIQQAYGVSVQRAIASEQTLTEAIEQITSGVSSDA